MAKQCVFLTHPNVVISASVPVTEWPLSQTGRDRMQACLSLPWVRRVSAIVCSTERKALESAEIVARHLNLEYHVDARLGENDRSATGYLPADEFETVADQFFAFPEQSVRGWERALDAQQRIVRAVEACVAADLSSGALLIVAHGAVGALLRSHLADQPIDRRFDQPPNSGGNYFAFSLNPIASSAEWLAIDQGVSG